MDVQELERHLDDVRRKRGYLLPHHGLMATALPGMLEDYDRLYTSLALTPRHLDRLEHEAVWLVVLIAGQRRERTGGVSNAWQACYTRPRNRTHGRFVRSSS